MKTISNLIEYIKIEQNIQYTKQATCNMSQYKYKKKKIQAQRL